MGFKIVRNLKKMGIKFKKFNLKRGEKIRKWREYSGYCDTWEPVAPLGQLFAACYYIHNEENPPHEIRGTRKVSAQVKSSDQVIFLSEKKLC